MIGQGGLVRRRYCRRWLGNLRQVCAGAVGATPGDSDPLMDMAGWLADIQSLRDAADPLVALWAEGAIPSAEAIRQTWAAQYAVILRPARGPYDPWDMPLPPGVMAGWQLVLTTPSTGQVWPAYRAETATLTEDAWRLAAHILLEQALTIAEAATVILEMEVELPVLLPADLELITADTRRALQAAVETHRALFGLRAYGLIEIVRNIGDTVAELAAAALAKTPPIITRTVPATMTPYLLAHTWYGDFQRADELRRLNPLLARRPLDWRAGEVVRTYAR